MWQISPSDYSIKKITHLIKASWLVLSYFPSSLLYRSTISHILCLALDSTTGKRKLQIKARTEGARGPLRGSEVERLHELSLFSELHRMTPKYFGKASIISPNLGLCLRRISRSIFLYIQCFGVCLLIYVLSLAIFCN